MRLHLLVLVVLFHIFLFCVAVISFICASACCSFSVLCLGVYFLSDYFFVLQALNQDTTVTHDSIHEFTTSQNHVTYHHIRPSRTIRSRIRHLLMLFMRCFTGNMKYRSKHRETGVKEIGNSVSDIDIWSRYVFPPTFLLFNIVYWTWYLLFS